MFKGLSSNFRNRAQAVSSPSLTIGAWTCRNTERCLPGSPFEIAKALNSKTDG
jgi:hypothetical protein